VLDRLRAVCYFLLVSTTEQRGAGTMCQHPQGREYVADGEAAGVTRHDFELSEFGRCRYCGERDEYRTGSEVER
jgi:hypothetical protein